MKYMTIFGLLFCSVLVCFGQYKTVVFNYEKSLFNEGQPLPAESYFTLSGMVSPAVALLEVKLMDEKSRPGQSALYQKTWKRQFNNTGQQFELPINFKLRSQQKYDVIINYYRRITAPELQELKSALSASLESYIDQNLLFEKKRIELLKNDGAMVGDMNSIVRSSLQYYRSATDMKFTGFSDLVLDKIKIIERTKQNRFLGRKSSESENLVQKERHLQEFKTRVNVEVSYFLNSGLVVLADTKRIDDYPVEKVKNIVTFHGGFGGVYLGDEIGGDDFGSAPMVGLTLPLGKKAFASPFWNRTAIMAGIFLGDFEGDNGIRATGPIIEQPIYVGLGYRLFQFIRLSGGMTLLENQGVPDNVTGVKEGMYVRPYVGIVADINFWMDLGK